MSFITKVKAYVVTHKVITAIVALVVIWGGYKIYSSYTSGGTATEYSVATVARGTVISTVTGTGQVSASDQLAIQSKVSGNVTSVNVASGQTVKAGDLIAEVDPTDAGISLDSAKLSLAKLTEPTDASSLLSAQNDLVTAQQAEIDAVAAQVTDYSSALNEIANTFVDIPSVINGMRNMYYTSTGFLSTNNTLDLPAQVQSNIVSAGAEFDVFNRTYDSILPTYKTINQSSATSSISSLLSDTYSMTVQAAEAIKDTKNTVDYIQAEQLEQSTAAAATTETNLNSWTSEITGHLANLQSIQNSIADAQNNITNAQESVSQKQAALQQLQTGADPLDVQSDQLAIQQQQDAYDDYFIRAPFDGIVANLTVKPADPISSGTTLATLITTQQIADISLNEVDVSKVSVGQKATVTFDAVDGLTITGVVTEVDQIGTVSQGVVSYNVEIAFDTEDPRVKPGMSANATIETAVDQDVVVVPNSAVKTSGNTSYVQIVASSTPVTQGNKTEVLSVAPVNQPVQISISDDTNTVVTSGLAPGDVVVTKTVTATAAAAAAKTTSTASAPSLFGAAGAGGATRGGGGGGRGITP